MQREKVVFNRSKFKGRRQSLRNNAPEAERVLWNLLKNKQLNGFKFRRQYGVGPYVLDFYCPLLRLAIEIDGPSHFEKGAREYDEQRQVYVEHFDIHFLRFTNREVYGNLGSVIQVIRDWIVGRS